MNDAPSFIEICGLDGKPIPFNDWPLALVFRGEAVENREYLVRQLATGREKIFSYNGRLFTGEDGDEIVLLSVRDVTQRKLAEEALRLSEARLRRAQSIARLGSWELTLADQMMWLSAETALMLGFGADALSMPLSEFREHLEPDDLDALDLATDAALAGIAVFDVEMRFQTTSGRTHVFYSQADIMFDDFGKVRGLAGTLMDISEKHELQSQFLQAQKMEAIGRLSGGVAHDFNNALSIIGGYGELLLLEDCLSNQDGHQYVRRILEAHEQARGLTKQLLAFSRKQPVSKTPVDLNEAVEGLSEMLRRLIGEDIYLDVCCDPRSMVTVADKGQLEQVVMNLVVNARDAMPKGGRISISTNLTEVDPARDSALSNLSRGQYAILRVRDTGCGMDEATKAKIFEPFFTTKSAGQGTGLGLSTVYGIVSQYSGAVTVQSNVGQGTTFSIYLPVAESRTNSLPSAQNLASRTGGSESILLLEDSESMRTLLSRSLRSVGYRVFCAADGKEAMAIANANGGSIDLLLSDVILPGLSGPEVAKQLKQTLPHIRCLFMSGYTDEFLARSQALGGILDVIDKPFQMDALLQRIRKVLETPEVFARLA
jgi:signal transduction histidine kinase/ActR/RegA family two-component response regulator